MLTTLAYLSLGVFAILGIVVGVSLGLGHVLVRRRPPDPPDDPANYGLDYESVTFLSRYKARLHGWWLPHPAAKGTLIISHGQNGSMAGDLPLAAALHAQGYNVLMYDQRAHGESDGQHLTYGVFEKEDLLGAIDYLQAEKGVGKVAILGLSMGASVAMIAAALTHSVSVLVLDGVYERFVLALRAAIRQRVPLPGLDLLLAQLGVSGASLITNTRMFQVSPVLWARHLREVAVLFIHCEYDHITSREAVQRLADDLDELPYRIWEAPGCTHRQAFAQDPEAYIAQIAAWLDAHYTP